MVIGREVVKAFFLTFAAFIGSIGVARADIGDHITCAPFSGPLICSQPSAVVGSGIEFYLNDLSSNHILSVDFDARHVTIAAAQDFTDLTAIFFLTNAENPVFSFYQYERVGNLDGILQATFSSNPPRLYFDTFHLSATEGSYLRILLVVPEPASWIILLSGFALGGIMLRRRRYKLKAEYA
jgi:hypothetical protein